MSETKIRPELKRLIGKNKYGRMTELADFLGISRASMSMMVSRGYMSKKIATIVEEKTGGKFKARLLVKK